MLGSTLVYVTTLPNQSDCERVKDGTETLYVCDGVVYRSTFHEDTQVYEIVSPSEDEVTEAQSMLGLGLTSPLTRGQGVRDLQNLLVEIGYDVGAVDGVFGTATETALLWVQYDYELEQTGMVDEPTARALGILPPAATPSVVPNSEAASGSVEETESDGAGASVSDGEPSEGAPPEDSGDGEAVLGDEVQD